MTSSLRALTGALVACLVAACGGEVGADGPGGSTPGGAGGAPPGGAGGAAGSIAGGTGGTGAVAPSDGILVLNENDAPMPGAIVVVDRETLAQNYYDLQPP